MLGQDMSDYFRLSMVMSG